MPHLNQPLQVQHATFFRVLLLLPVVQTLHLLHHFTPLFLHVRALLNQVSFSSLPLERRGFGPRFPLDFQEEVRSKRYTSLSRLPKKSMFRVLFELI